MKNLTSVIVIINIVRYFIKLMKNKFNQELEIKPQNSNLWSNMLFLKIDNETIEIHKNN